MAEINTGIAKDSMNPVGEGHTGLIEDVDSLVNPNVTYVGSFRTCDLAAPTLIAKNLSSGPGVAGDFVVKGCNDELVHDTDPEANNLLSDELTRDTLAPLGSVGNYYDGDWRHLVMFWESAVAATVDHLSVSAYGQTNR